MSPADRAALVSRMRPPLSQLLADAAAAADMADDVTVDAGTRRAAREWAAATTDYIQEVSS